MEFIAINSNQTLMQNQKYDLRIIVDVFSQKFDQIDCLSPF